MVPGEILLSESQERMCYEVTPGNTGVVKDIAARFDLESSVIGTLTDDEYVCTFNGETVVQVPPGFVADGAPIHDRETTSTPAVQRELPGVSVEEAFKEVLASPNTVSRAWVFRQYDHEVGIRTGVPPGADAAILAIREADVGLGISAGTHPNWTAVDPYQGAKASVLANAMDLAVTGARPLAVVDCLNAGNPETPAVFTGFSEMTRGLGAMCEELEVPVVGGNVSLYNDSESGPIPPTPMVMMVGRSETYRSPGCGLTGDQSILLVGPPGGSLGGSEYLAKFTGSDSLPTLPDTVGSLLDTVSRVSDWESTSAIHNSSVGGLGVTLAEMVTTEIGASIEIATEYSDTEVLFSEIPTRVLIETTEPERVSDEFDGPHECREIGHSTKDGELAITVNASSVQVNRQEITSARSLFEETLDDGS
jgi:phosphoribosylformylglycinamidine synthase